MAFLAAMTADAACEAADLGGVLLRANSAFNLSREAKPVEQRANAGSETEGRKLADAAS